MGEDPRDRLQEERVEVQLRTSRPRPDPAFVEALEQRLFPRQPVPQRRPLFRWPTLAGGLAVAATAAGLLLAGLAGGGPLAPNGSDAGSASSRCHTAPAHRLERQPVVFMNARGRLAVRYEKRMVTREVTRCR